MNFPHNWCKNITSFPALMVLSFSTKAIDTILEKCALMPYVEETIEERMANSGSPVKSRLDEELFDNLADIINGNFVLEVEASLERRS